MARVRRVGRGGEKVGVLCFRQPKGTVRTTSSKSNVVSVVLIWTLGFPWLLVRPSTWVTLVDR